MVLARAAGVTCSGLLLLSVVACGGGGGSKPKPNPPQNAPPVVGAPTGPGAVQGVDPDYRSTVGPGGSLGLTVTASDPDAADVLVLQARITGGTLTASQAGFLQSFPVTVQGVSPQVIALTGTAAQAGSVELTFDADDGAGGAHAITLTVFINEPPWIERPSGPGVVGGADPDYLSLINIGDSLDFNNRARDPNPTDDLTFRVAVTGGSLTWADAGFAFFPGQITGPAPLMLVFTGTAAASGDVVLTYTVDDGAGGVDVVTHTIVIDTPPAIGKPTGPGIVQGIGPAYTTTIKLGDPLDFQVTGTDADVIDSISLTATATGGTLTAAEMGFNENFPVTVWGTSPQTLGLTGTAAMYGTTVLTIEADDGRGGVASITHTIRINSPPDFQVPTGPGVVTGSGSDFSATVFLASPLDFLVRAVDPDGDAMMLTADVTAGSLTPAQAGLNEAFPASTTGPSPRSLLFSGTASALGDIEITFDADDGRAGNRVMVLSISIVPDTIPPDPIGDLAAAYTGTPDEILLSWTAAGDDGDQGTATAYILKFSPTPITDEAEFLAATDYPQSWVPLPAGSDEQHAVDLGLVGSSWYSGTVYLAIKATDEVSNSGALESPLAADTNPRASFPPPGHPFGRVDFRDIREADFTVSHDPESLVDLVLTGVGIAGNAQFDITAGGGAGFILAPGDDHTVTVRFAPVSVGSFMATLSVSHNDPGRPSPWSTDLLGLGVNSSPVVTAGPTPSATREGRDIDATVDVRDGNSALPAVNDVVSVEMDLSPLGGPASFPMTYLTDDANRTATYTATVDTTGFPVGVHDVTVTATDGAGATGTGRVIFPIFDGGIHEVPGGYATIQAAIDAASDGDLVRLNGGTYAGPGNKDLRIGGKEIILGSRDGPASAIIDCEGTGSAFLFDSTGETSSTAIVGITIRGAGSSAIVCREDASPTVVGCVFESNRNTTHGGALVLDGPLASPRIVQCSFDGNGDPQGVWSAGAIFLADESRPVLVECTFTDNVGSEAGAIFSKGGRATILDCAFTGNRSLANHARGGAIFLGGAHTVITGCAFEGNVALGSTFEGHGGAMYISADATIRDCTFELNSASGTGGAMALGFLSNVRVLDSLFVDNEADEGGAIHVGATVPGRFLEVVGCQFRGNRVTGHGGAIRASGPERSLVVRDTIIAGCESVGAGGGIYLEGGILADLENCLIVGNTSLADGGGILISSDDPAAVVSIRNGTVADNGVPGIRLQQGTLILTDSIVWDGMSVDDDPLVAATVTYTTVVSVIDPGIRINSPAGFQVGVLGNLGSDPLFALGPDSGYHLSQTASGQGVDSPCVDAGSDTAASLGLSGRSTRTDGAPDTGVVDIGFHF